MLKRAGKTSPMAASSRTGCVRVSNSTRLTVATPVAAAATMSSGDAMFSVAKKASTMPSRMAWLMASLISAMRRNTRNTPGNAQAMATGRRSTGSRSLPASYVSSTNTSVASGKRRCASECPAAVSSHRSPASLATHPCAASARRLRRAPMPTVASSAAPA